MSDESDIFQTPGQFQRETIPPASVNELLRAMVNEQRETNKRLAKIEVELLGREGDRSTGLIFRLADLERKAGQATWVLGTIAIAVIGLIVSKLWTVMTGQPGAP